MRFDFTDLRLFQFVVQTGSITRGAERAHLALASASARIRGMEEILGVPPAEARPTRCRADRGGAAACSTMPASFCSRSKRCAATSAPIRAD